MICIITQKLPLESFFERLDGNEYYEKNHWKVSLVCLEGTLRNDTAKFKCGRYDEKKDILPVIEHIADSFSGVDSFKPIIEQADHVYAWLTCGGNFNAAAWKDGVLHELLAGRRHGVNYLSWANADTGIEVSYIDTQRPDLLPWQTTT